MTGLLTDRYELQMAASYLMRDMTAPATFSLFVRALPASRGFLVVAGAEDCVDALESFRFEPDELAYLETLGFSSDVVDRLAALRFDGDVDAVPEGRTVFADEPIVELTASLPVAQLVETVLVNHITYQTAVASKAARHRLAAGTARLVDFSFRRTHGVEAGIAVARAAVIAGFDATSNVEAARRHGLVATGTMAHAYVQAFAVERDAFVAFAQDTPSGVTFLVDTYDTLVGVATAIDVIHAVQPAGPLGVRLDSGDLELLSKRARTMLDAAGLSDVAIVVSGGLDEYQIARLVAAGAPIDVFGVGTKLGVSADAPSLDSAYKLVAYDGRPVMKLSPGKATLPGPKQVWRRVDGAGIDEVIATRDESGPAGYEALLQPAMRRGRRVAGREPVEWARARCSADLARLPAAARSLSNPRAPVARRTPALVALADQTAAAACPPGHRPNQSAR